VALVGATVGVNLAAAENAAETPHVRLLCCQSLEAAKTCHMQQRVVVVVVVVVVVAGPPRLHQREHSGVGGSHGGHEPGGSGK
jgi:hypothetical protein